MKTIKEYIEDKGLHYEFGSSQLDLISDIIKEVKEKTIIECSDLLKEFNIDDNNILKDKIKLGYIK